MKLNKWLYGAAALAMLAACSDKDIAPDGGDDIGEHKFSEGISYLGINIELPTEPVSRAGESDHSNDQYDDGLQAEYSVNNAALLLFKGATEGTAKFVGAYELTFDSDYESANGDNITTSFHKTIKVLNKPVLGSNEKLWGLALVNYDIDHFKISASEDGSYGNLTLDTPDKSAVKITRIKDEKPAVEASGDTPAQAAVVATTFDQFRLYTSTCEFNKRNTDNSIKRIFMTNAPLSNKAGSSTTATTGAVIQTLAELKDNFKATEEAALDNPAGCVFVERAVAKITCGAFPTYATLVRTDVTNNTTVEVKIGIDNVSWIVDNEEETSYIVRNAKTTEGTSYPFWSYAHPTNGKYRFIGSVGMNDFLYDADPVHDEAKNKTWYRTYWCLDPNYASIKPYNNQAAPAAGEPKFEGLTSSEGNNFKSTVALYPHENTFDVAHQTYENTTRVVFKVQYGTTGTYTDASGETKTLTNCNFYAIRGQLKTFYLQEDADNLLMGSVLRSKSLLDLIEKYQKDDVAPRCDVTSFTKTIDTADEEIKANNIEEGDYILQTLSFTDDFIKDNFKTLSAEDKQDIQSTLDDIKTAANVANHIVPFNDNTCYYAVYIQHFGNTYCPLWTDWKGETTSVVYQENDAQKYLGRYGLVRNNWYDLMIDNISRLGNAKVPVVEGDDTSDDNNQEEWYLSARIHILSWARRTQHHSF